MKKYVYATLMIVSMIVTFMNIFDVYLFTSYTDMSYRYAISWHIIDVLLCRLLATEYFKNKKKGEVKYESII